MTDGNLEILYEAGPCLVINKPAGLLTQAPPGIDSLELRVRRFLQQREGKSHPLYLGLPHRLDRPVSGAIVFARNVRAAQRITRQFEARTVEKSYWTLVEGRLDEDTGTWIDWMRKVPDQPRSEIVAPEAVGAQRAVLHYRLVERSESTTWLEIRLETGRTHQIRLQAAAHGHPVLGDVQYGSQRSFGPATDDLRARWIALHARRLKFEHPMTRDTVEIVAPLPAGWECDDIQPGV